MRREQGLIVAAILTAEVCSALESTMVLAALHSWIRIYKEPALVGWVVTSYLLVAGSTAAIAGRLGDIFGRRRVILCLLAACGTGSAISAFGNAIEWIIVGRAVQGLAGGILPLAYALLREHLPEDKVPLGVGMVVAAATLSGSLGLLLGGYLTDTFGPNSVFWASMAWAALSFTAIVAIVPRGRIGGHVGKVDFAGGLMLCPIIAVVLFGVSNGNQAGWLSPLVLGSIAAGVAGLALWTWHELRVDHPLIDIRLLGNRSFLFANLILVCCAVGAMQFLQLVSLLLQQPVWTGVGLGLTATMLGIVKIPSMVCGTFASLISGWASGRFGARSPMLIGSGAAGLGLTLAAFDHGSIAIIIVVLIVSTMGVTMTYAAIPNAIMTVVPSERTGEATGLMAVVRSVSRAVGSQLLMLLLATSVVREAATDAKFPTDESYTLVLLLMAGLSFLGMLLSLALPKSRGLSGRTVGQKGTPKSGTTSGGAA